MEVYHIGDEIVIEVRRTSSTRFSVLMGFNSYRLMSSCREQVHCIMLTISARLYSTSLLVLSNRHLLISAFALSQEGHLKGKSVLHDGYVPVD